MTLVAVYGITFFCREVYPPKIPHMGSLLFLGSSGTTLHEQILEIDTVHPPRLVSPYQARLVVLFTLKEGTHRAAPGPSQKSKPKT